MDIEDIKKYQEHGRNLRDATGDQIYFERNRTITVSNQSKIPVMRPAIWMSKIDPLSSMMVGLPSDGYGHSRLIGYREDFTLNHDDDHFWFRSVYRVVHVPYARNTDTSSLRSFAEAMKSSVLNAGTGLGHDLIPVIGGDWRNPPDGYMYLVMEGGGPLDGVSNDVTIVRNIRNLENQNFSGHMLNSGEYWRQPKRGTSCMMRKPDSSEYNELMEGTMLIRPTNTMGYIRGHLQFSENQFEPWALQSWDNNTDLIRRVKQYDEKYHPYTGWIPEDLTRVAVDTEKFSLVEIDREPKSYFGTDLIERVDDRVLHFKGAVTILVGDKRHNISPGCYFLLPKDNELTSMDMLSYDALVRELLEQVVMSTSSSRSQAITNRIADMDDGVVKTSITTRGLSGKSNGDSGFIARPTLRRLR